MCDLWWRKWLRDSCFFSKYFFSPVAYNSTIVPLLIHLTASLNKKVNETCGSITQQTTVWNRSSHKSDLGAVECNFLEEQPFVILYICKAWTLWSSLGCWSNVNYYVTMQIKIKKKKNWIPSGTIFLLAARLKVDRLYEDYISKCERSGSLKKCEGALANSGCSRIAIRWRTPMRNGESRLLMLQLRILYCIFILLRTLLKLRSLL